jgi:hypothetical protein
MHATTSTFVRWEPSEARVSRSVLRESRGATPRGYSPVIIRKMAQLKGDTGTTFSEVGGLFEGVGELEDAEVLLVAAYDL